MLVDEPDNPYYRSFECGMLTLDAFLSKKTDRVVYWGTSGERITDSYAFDSFGMAELVESSVLLYGKDIRKELKYPTFHELYADVKRHYIRSRATAMVKMNGCAAIDSARPFRFLADKAAVAADFHLRKWRLLTWETENSKHSKCMYTCEIRRGTTGISLQNSKQIR